MQFPTLITLALAACASAAMTPTYGNGTAPIYPSGTVGTAAPSGTTGTGATTTASFIPNTGAASRMSTGMGAMGLAIVGGVAMAL